MTNKEISYAPEDTLQEIRTRTITMGLALNSRLGIKPKIEHGEKVYGPLKARTEDFVLPWQLDYINSSVGEILESVEKRGQAYSWYDDEFSAMATTTSFDGQRKNGSRTLILHKNTLLTSTDIRFTPNKTFELSIDFLARENGLLRRYQYTSGDLRIENMTVEEYRFIAQNLQEFSSLLGKPSRNKQAQKQRKQ